MMRLEQAARIGLTLLVLVFLAGRAVAAPYAAMVMDMRSGEVLYSRNADTQLHPASLTKMMTLYIAFEAIEHGEISLDTMVTVSANAAAEPPSHLGLRRGQRIKLRYLIRAAAVKSANDAATAIGEAIAGSEDAFAARMNRTAAALGMKNTHFRNANGLTRSGHLSSAHDMTIMGRHLFYDYPDYYNLFSRRTADVGGREVPNTNTRFLNAYRGADGIKTGYTNAAGFNLVASAQRGSQRIITTVFGGTSTAQRNAKVAELMNLGFRKAPTRVAERRPARPPYQGATSSNRYVAAAPTTSIRPRMRPTSAPSETLVARLDLGIDAVIADVVETSATVSSVAEIADVRPAPRPEGVAEITMVSAPAEAVEATIDAAAAEQAPVEIAAIEPATVEPAAVEEVTPDQPEEMVIASADIAVETATPAAPVSTAAPAPRLLSAEELILTPTAPVEEERAPAEVVTRVSTSGGHHWGINVGRYGTEFQARSVLVETALAELSTLGDALRKVTRSSRGFEANFVGLTEEGAANACRRLEMRDTSCKVIGPT